MYRKKECEKFNNNMSYTFLLFNPPESCPIDKYCKNVNAYVLHGGGGGGGVMWMDIVFVDLFSTQNSFYGKCCQRDSCEPCDGNRICDIFCVGQTSFVSTSHTFGTNCKALWSWNVNCSCSGNSCILRAKEFTDFVLTDLCANHARCSGHFPWNVSLIVRRNGRKSSAFSVQGNEWSAELTGNTWHVRWKAGKRKETNVTISLWNVMLPQYTHHVSHRCPEMFWRTFLEDTPNSSAPNGTIGFPEAVKPYHRWSQRNTI